MELTLIFLVFGLTVNATSEDSQDYQSLRTESTTYPAALPSKDQNNSSHNSRKGSTESLTRLTVALIASPGTDLFHAPHERHHSTLVNAMTATADKVIGSKGERFVSNQGSSSFTLSADSASAMQLAPRADRLLITDVKEKKSVVTSTQAGSGLVMSSSMTAAAHLSRGRENIAALLHAPLNSKNQRAMESITLLPTKSIAMLSASDPAVIDNLGEATETEERQRKSINENGTLKTLGTTNPLNATESMFTDEEKTFVQKGSPTIMRLTALPNKAQLDDEGSAAGVRIVAREPGEGFEKGQPGQKNMPALSLVTRRNNIFDVDTPLPLGLSGQEVVKGTAQSTKLLPTEEQTSIMMVYTNAVDEKLPDSEFFHPLEMPFPKTGKLYVTSSFVTSPLTPKLLQRIVSAGDKSERELTSLSTSARDGQVGTTIYSPSQSAQSPQSTTTVKDEGRLKFVTVLPSKFTDRPSVLIKVKNATQPENSLLVAPQSTPSTDSHFFHMSEHCCKVSVENRTSYPQGNENDDTLIPTDDRTEHFHTLINTLMTGASSTTPFAVAPRVMTISAQSKSDSDSAEHSESIVTKLTPNSLISASNSMHHLQNIPTTPFQIPPREIQNLSPIFEGHSVTYSPVRQLLIPSLTGNAKPLTFLSSPSGQAPFHSGHVLKEHPLIVPLGHSASTPKLVTFQDLKKAQGSTSFQPANKNTEPTVFLKLLTSHSERLITTTNTWPVSGNSSFAQFTSTAGPDKRSTLLPSVSSLNPALQTRNTNVPTKNFHLAENFATPSFFDTKPEFHIFTVSHKKTPRKTMPVSSLQYSVSRPGRTAVVSKRFENTERSVIGGDFYANQKVVTEQTAEKHVSHNVLTSVGNENGTLEQKTAGNTDLRGMFLFSQSPLKQQSEQDRSDKTKGESSTGALVLDQYGQNTFSMQNENQTPATVLLENTVSSSQSRGKDLQKTTEGQINTSVSPAAVESFQSTQPLASLAVAETPKMVEQAINQASSLSSTLSSIISAASNGKDFNGPLLPYQTTQHAASARDHLQRAASSQVPSTLRALKRHTINNSAVNHLTLNPSLSPPPNPTIGLMRSAVSAGGRNMQSTSHLLPSAPSQRLTDFQTTSRAHSRILQPYLPPLHDVEENVRKELSTQTILPSVTEGTFFAINHNYGSLADFERTESTESLQTGSVRLLETSEGRPSTVFPFETDLSKPAELMSDLPVMQRRMRIASPDFLSGLAQISDDICGSGNYTAEMRLTLERDIMPGDLVPALGNLRVVINLKTNNTQVNLEIKSCCLSPSVRLDEFNTTCCLFSRLPIDPQGIRLLPSVLSKRASFTISLFQMINYSTAYLHCDLSVCLRNNSECERCQQKRNAHFTNDGEIIFSHTGNRISFGPVLKETDVSPFIQKTGVDSAEAAAILVSVSGCFLVCVALLLLWTVYRHRLQRSGHCWIPYGCSRNGEHFLP